MKNFVVMFLDCHLNIQTCKLAQMPSVYMQMTLIYLFISIYATSTNNKYAHTNIHKEIDI